jgi:hypothetical protein
MKCTASTRAAGLAVLRGEPLESQDWQLMMSVHSFVQDGDEPCVIFDGGKQELRFSCLCTLATHDATSRTPLIVLRRNRYHDTFYWYCHAGYGSHSQRSSVISWLRLQFGGTVGGNELVTITRLLQSIRGRNPPSCLTNDQSGRLLSFIDPSGISTVASDKLLGSLMVDSQQDLKDTEELVWPTELLGCVCVLERPMYLPRCHFARANSLSLLLSPPPKGSPRCTLYRQRTQLSEALLDVLYIHDIVGLVMQYVTTGKMNGVLCNK